MRKSGSRWAKHSI
ncbi:MAG: hypothetical protein JRC90_09415 [Deltaproteobacteria bacterium]|nr:hypothetical protein [Deltaproteobacteria bacterium]